MDLNILKVFKGCRSTVTWLVLAMTLIPVAGYALGLGPITMRSALNQPLLAEIDIHSVQSGDLDGLAVRMASAEDFKRISVEKSGFLDRITFKVLSRGDGSPYIQLSTAQAVTEPYLDFLIEARWPRGRALKEYTVLVDPPVLTAEAPAPVQQAQSRPTFKKPKARSRNKPAPRRSPAASSQRFKPTPRPVEPEFSEPSPVREAPVREIAERDEGSLNYGVVRRNDTLSEIAQSMRPSDISLQQMMLALQRSNPSAFIGNNINKLKAGAVLRIDDPGILEELSRREAAREVRIQTVEWREESRTRVVQQSDIEPDEGESIAVADAGSSISESNQARLELVAPGKKGAGAGGSMEDSEEVNQLRENLMMATEALDANKQESGELKSRLGELEEQLESMQRLINLKDQEMASLQGTLKNRQDNVEAAEPVPEQRTEQRTEQDSGASVVDSLFTDQMIMGLGLLLVIAVVAWLVIRRRKMQEGFEESILNVGGMQDNVVSAQDFNATFDGGATMAGRSATMSQSPSVGSMASSFAVSDVSGIHSETTDVDPISEADVYMAYGRHQQAEDILKQALNADKSRTDVHSKLLEVYKAAGNQKDFEESAQSLYNQLGGNESHPDWQAVAAMGAEFCPGSPLFGGGAETITKMSMASDFGGVTAEEEDLLDFNFEGEGDLTMDMGSTAAGTEEDEHSLDFDISSLDFNLDEEDGSGVDETQQAMANLDSFSTDNSLDFELPDDEELTESNTQMMDFDTTDLAATQMSGSPIELVDNAGVAEEEPFELSLDDDALALEEVDDFGDTELSGEFDEDIFANVDEIGTKLDLAKAYVDMGDSDGARSILDEVMEEGDDTQKEQAQTLLQQMG